MTPDQLRTEGRADAAVLLVARRVNPTVSLQEWARHLGLTELDIQHAVRRLKDRARQHTSAQRAGVVQVGLAGGKDPTRPTSTGLPRGAHPDAPHACPQCDVRYWDRRGLARHILAQHTPPAPCEHCGKVINAAGIGPHRRACTGSQAGAA